MNKVQAIIVAEGICDAIVTLMRHSIIGGCVDVAVDSWTKERFVEDVTKVLCDTLREEED